MPGLVLRSVGLKEIQYSCQMGGESEENWGAWRPEVENPPIQVSSSPSPEEQMVRLRMSRGYAHFLAEGGHAGLLPGARGVSAQTVSLIQTPWFCEAISAGHRTSYADQLRLLREFRLNVAAGEEERSPSESLGSLSTCSAETVVAAPFRMGVLRTPTVGSSDDVEELAKMEMLNATPPLDIQRPPPLSAEDLYGPEEKEEVKGPSSITRGLSSAPVCDFGVETESLVEHHEARLKACAIGKWLEAHFITPTTVRGSISDTRYNRTAAVRLNCLRSFSSALTQFGEMKSGDWRVLEQVYPPRGELSPQGVIDGGAYTHMASDAAERFVEELLQELMSRGEAEAREERARLRHVQVKAMPKAPGFRLIGPKRRAPNEPLQAPSAAAKARMGPPGTVPGRLLEAASGVSPCSPPNVTPKEMPLTTAVRRYGLRSKAAGGPPLPFHAADPQSLVCRARHAAESLIRQHRAINQANSSIPAPPSPPNVPSPLTPGLPSETEPEIESDGETYAAGSSGGTSSAALGDATRVITGARQAIRQARMDLGFPPAIEMDPEVEISPTCLAELIP